MFRFSRFCCSALLLTSCALPSANPAQPATAGGDTWLEVKNDHWRTIHVFVIASDTRVLLGDVAPNRINLFRIPIELLGARGQVRFLADPEGTAEEHISDPVQLNGIGRIHWELKKNLQNSRPRKM